MLRYGDALSQDYFEGNSVTDEEKQLLEAYRVHIMKLAYESFLDWAALKQEILAEYDAFIDEALSQGAYEDVDKSFT